MPRIHKISGAIPFFLAIFLNAFIDLGHKIIIQNTIFKLYNGREQIILTAIVNAMILLPFILLLSPSGFLSDVVRKTKVMRMAAWLVVILTSFITVFYYLGLFWPAFIMTFLLSAQATIYSPAKFGYIKELFGKEGLSQANGIACALSIVGILAGTAIFSVFFELHCPQQALNEAHVLKAIAPLGFILILSSLVEVFMLYRLPENKNFEASSETFSIRSYVTGKLLVQKALPILKNRIIFLSIVGLSVFWGIGQVMLAAFPAFIKEELFMNNTMIVQGILACSGIGIALGSLVAGQFSKNYIETGLLPFGALGLAAGLFILPYLHSYPAFIIAFLIVGFAGGVITVPFNALIQFHASEHNLGRTLAVNNWIQNLVMLFFLCLTVSFSLLGLSSKSLLVFVAAVALIGLVYTIYELPQSLVRFFISIVFARLYRIKVLNMKNIPATGGVFLLGNHMSWIDWAILQLASPRPVRFVMLRSIYERRFLKWIFDLFGSIPIDSGSSLRASLSGISDSLNRGEMVCMFPEGTISRTGHIGEFRRGYEYICTLLNNDVVIVPFYLHGLWGSQFSRSSAHVKVRQRTISKRDIIVTFGAALEKNTKADVLKRCILNLSVHSWKSYIETFHSIAEEWVYSAKRMGNQISIIDTQGIKLSAHKALAIASAMSKRISFLPEKNIGILMPSSAAGMLINMAVILSGKTVVNLNYTASQSAFASALEQANIKTIYTSQRFLQKLKNKGFHIEALLENKKVIELESFFKSISSIEKILRLFCVKLFPAYLLKLIFCRQQIDDVAVILFSSGSEGMPKGVQLSHKNIITNTKQIIYLLNVEEKELLMANLPLFHAFGLTVTQFMPLLEGIPVICYPDPTDVLACAKAIALNKVTVLFGTSTFLRLYCKNPKIHALMLSSIRLVVAGAEKLHDDVRKEFSLKFNLPIYEGYGATETTPVVSVNLPDKIDFKYWETQLGTRIGSVGMPLLGTSCKIVDPNTYKELETGESGMVLVGGEQVMLGYLNNPDKTSQVIKDYQGLRYYVTGDKGYLDEDGFLFIQDRYSRFAKIAGEIVSLFQVESAIKKIISKPDFEIIVVAIPDPIKGERLLSLVNLVIDEDFVRTELVKQGLNTLAFPSEWILIDKMPMLGSGKADFSLAKKIALDAVNKKSV